jgi:hypothetical protein
MAHVDGRGSERPLRLGLGAEGGCREKQSSDLVGDPHEMGSSAGVVGHEAVAQGN